MRQLCAFLKKELLELLRTGKLMFLVILGCLFGVMNPAIAKLTPWLMAMMSRQLAEAGMTIGEIEINAFTSWTQFFKNLPIELIVIVVMFSGILTMEYQRGTLINIVTKGLNRWKIMASKGVILLFVWTAMYVMNYGITYSYNKYFWDNSTTSHVFFAAFCFYLFGLWIISIILPASVWSHSGSAVMLTVGGAFLCAYLLGMFPAIKELLPSYLMNTSGLINGAAQAEDYTIAIIVTCILIVGNMGIAMAGFNKKSNL